MPKKTFLYAGVKSLNEEGIRTLTYIIEHIKKRREKLDISQRQLSKLMRRSNNFISKLENGQLEPSILDVIEIAQHLETPLDYFLPAKYRDKKGKAEQLTIEDIKEERQKAIEALEKLATNHD